MPTISVSLIFRNEERNLPAWLKSVKPFADEIVAIDSGSTDRGPEILAKAGAKVEFRKWTGYSDQRNYADSLCTCDWVLYLDADERPDADMARALNRFKKNPDIKYQCFDFSTKVFFWGRFLRHGGFYPEHHLRMSKRGQGKWEERPVHEKLTCPGPKGNIPGYVEHYSYNTVSEYLTRMNDYSGLAAKEMHAAGRRATGFTAFSHALWCFINRYFLRMGFLDGYEGYLAARLDSLYTLAKYSKLRELNRKKGAAK